MTNTQLAELLLVRLYDLAEAQGHFELHALNEIAAEFGVTDKSRVFNLAKALEGRGLIQASFTSGPTVKACITGEGVLLVEQGGDTGVIRDYREHPQSFSVAIDQSTHFHGAIANSNVAAHSPETTQSLAPAAEIVESTESSGEQAVASQKPRAFDLVGGFEALQASEQVFPTYVVVVFGIVGHWIWEVLVAGLGAGKFDFGSRVVILARIVVAAIAGIFSFTGIWRQLEGVDPKLRFFAAFTQGFAVDALTGPVVEKVGGSPP